MEDLLSTSSDATILFKQLTQKYMDDACAATRMSLFTSGIVSKAIGLATDPEALEELDHLLRRIAKDGITIIAVDKHTDKVAGIAFNKILVNGEHFFESYRTIFKNPKSRKLLEHLIITDNLYNFFEHRQVNCLMEHLFLGILPEYRRRGIAKKLTALSVNLAQKLYEGVNVKTFNGIEASLEPVPEIVTATFTSFISQRIGRILPLFIFKM